MRLRAMNGTASSTLALLLAGCTTLTPADFGAKAPELTAPWSGTIAVTPVKAAAPATHFNANGVTFEANLDDFSAHLAELVQSSLEKSGMQIGSDGKQIRVAVVYLDFLFRGPCLVDYEVELGNAVSFGLQSAGPSSNITKACRSALESSVYQILNDPRTVAYMGSE